MSMNRLLFIYPLIIKGEEMPDNLGRCLKNLNNRFASEVTGSTVRSMFNVYHFEKFKRDIFPREGQ